MKFCIADAFTDSILCGNPAGVVIIPEDRDFPSDELMIRTAAELRYSETAFIKRLSADTFQIRYFTPAAEVELCGHATIASFRALLHGGDIKDGSSCTARTLSGDLTVTVSGGFIMMDMAEPKELGKMVDTKALEDLYSVMGLSFSAQCAKGMLLRPQIISTGLPDIMLPVADRDELNAIAPDFSALSRLSKRYGVVGVHAFTTDADDGMLFRARNFAPLYGIDEEAATGTANGALTYYAYLNGLLQDGAECRILQGEAMGRPSVIMTSLRRDDSGKVFIRAGGSGAILAEGEIHLP